MASPPKPWERAGAGGTSTGVTAAANAPTSTVASAASSSEPPALPSRPSSLNSTVNQNASSYSTMNRPYGMGSSYGSSYSSPYSSMGGMGGMGGYGSYGSSMYGRSMYGGGGMYGGGYGGYGMGGGMYGGMGGMGGMPGDPNNPQGLTQSFSNSTAATFQMIESIVGAFGGFAQMLESTYMATHSSFFAMVSVAEQFGNLRQTLGSVLGIFTLMRWIRTAIAKLTGRAPPASSKELTPANFHSFNGRMPDGSPAAPRPSKKPFIMFMLTVIGLPYLMGKLIRAMARSQEEEERRRLEAMPGDQQQQMDPTKLEFCRVLYDFTPEANTNAVQGVDLAVKKGDLVAVLGKTDPMGNASEWWRCRSRDGRTGYLPSPYLEVIQRRPQAQIQSASQAGSRAQTMTSSTGFSRTGTMTKPEAETVPAKAPPPIEGKAGDMGVESFQKGMFQS
ncbi:peroxisomal membrane protein [Diplodia corticola]|uniref:Peroxisomal membrane protein PEX13 n=1 Tax=Diplodia corticola TaxID=236234 RepID=A0A1J9RBM7_9PEZI|nr:peroxisomal membrane protein [Diplodia corticola]OJD29859.1 peroxisomal membrane protein [Diplodia corticola]